MKPAILYKITNISNNMVYYGIVFGKNKTVEQRFEEHMTGKGGKFLFKYGVEVYGRESFTVEEIDRGGISEMMEKEVELNKNNLYPIGYNGNTSHALVLTEEQKIQALQKRNDLYEQHPERRPTPPNWKNRTRSEEMKRKLSESKKGHSVDQETREKIRKSLTGRKGTQESKNKRSRSLQDHPNAYNRSVWLAISPNDVYHWTHGKRNTVLNQIGCSISKSFYENLNTNIPIQFNQPSKNQGWRFSIWWPS